MDISPDHPIAGILAPLFAIRTESDLGIGDTQSLRELIDWAAKYQFRLVQLLPVNETGPDNSPYNAISSVAIEPTTICTTPEAIPDLTRRDFNASLKRYDLASLRAGAVLYPEVKQMKRELLEKAFARFCKNETAENSERAQQFRQFTSDEASWLGEYALFRALAEMHGTECWDQWPLEHSSFASAEGWWLARPVRERARFERWMRFFQYVQWIAFSQWRAVKLYAESKGVALMGDVPFGVSYYSADVFARPQIFDLTWSGGAPPEKVFKSDPFTEKWGQNWGIPIYRWDVQRERGFAWWRQRVEKIRGIFHLFRIDHVLGFFRVYGFPWRPSENERFLPLNGDSARQITGGRLPSFQPRSDDQPEDRDANRRDGEEYLRALLEETGEFRLVGEDLGLVPDYVRPTLGALHIAGFKVPQWETQWNGELVEGGSYERLSVTTYATHDHPPLMAMWEGLRADTESEDSHRSGYARWEMERLARFAKIVAPMPQPWSAEIHEALIEALLTSNSWIAVFMITDVLGNALRFNVPGAVAQSNWSQRMPRTMATFNVDPTTHEKMERISGLIAQAGR